MKIVYGLVTALTIAGASGLLGCSSDDGGAATTNDGGPSPAKDGGSTPKDGGSQPGADGAVTPGDDDDDDGPPVSGSADCTTVCDQLDKNCKGDNAQYASHDACMNGCAQFDEGKKGDTTENTVTCRVYHSDVAANEPVLHCWHGGAYGFGGCAGPCEGFCRIVTGWCGQSAGGSPYPSEKACFDTCLEYKTLKLLASGAPAINASGPASGDSFECRGYHLLASLGSTADRDLHCPHTAKASATCK